jgi:hypothetical protein
VARDFGQGAVMPARAAVSVGMADSLGSLEGLLGAGKDDPVRNIRDKPALRVKVQAQKFDEEELEEDTEDTQLTNPPDCNCPEGEECQCDGEDENEAEGTEQKPDESSIPKGEGDLIKPTEERQRIAAILICEEARGREELARVLALETNHTLDAAKKILSASPVASKTVNALEARMGQIQNPVVGLTGDALHDDSPAAEVQRILAFVPKARKHPQVQ